MNADIIAAFGEGKRHSPTDAFGRTGDQSDLGTRFSQYGQNRCS